MTVRRGGRLLFLLAGLVLIVKGDHCVWRGHSSSELPANPLSFTAEGHGGGHIEFDAGCLSNPRKCELGRGAFGVVYRGHLVKTNEDGSQVKERVAVKMTRIDSDSRDETSGFTSFRNEYRLTRLFRRHRASHPNVVTLRRADFFDATGTVARDVTKATCGVLVMELVESAVTLQEMFFTHGVSVDDISRLGMDFKWKAEMTDLNADNFVVNAMGPDLSDITTEIMIQIVSALDFLESYGIVHFDLKPDNILVEVVVDPSLPARIRVIVSDFGLAIAKEDHREGRDPMSRGNFVYNSNGQSCSFGKHTDDELIGGTCKGFDLRAARVILAELVSGVPAWIGCQEAWNVANDEESHVNLHGRRGVFCILEDARHLPEFAAAQRRFAQNAQQAIEAVARETGAKLAYSESSADIDFSNGMYDILSIVAMMGGDLLNSALSVLYVVCDSTYPIFPPALCSRYLKLSGHQSDDLALDAPAKVEPMPLPMPQHPRNDRLAPLHINELKLPPPAPGFQNGPKKQAATNVLRGGGDGGGDGGHTIDDQRPLKLDPLVAAPSGRRIEKRKARRDGPDRLRGLPIRRGQMGALSPIASAIRERSKQEAKHVHSPISPLAQKLPAIQKHLTSSLSRYAKMPPIREDRPPSKCSPGGLVVIKNSKHDCMLGRSNVLGQDLETPCHVTVFCGGDATRQKNIVFDKMFEAQLIRECKHCTVAPSA